VIALCLLCALAAPASDTGRFQVWQAGKLLGSESFEIRRPAPDHSRTAAAVAAG
jgi:hypothetical protein